MDKINVTIGNTLKNRRIALNIKQEDLAEQLGVTDQTVSKWERDVTEPKASQVCQLSQILKITEKEICRGTATNEQVEPFEFVRKVSALMNEIPHTELLIGMQDFIDDEEGFFKMLANISNYPYDVFAEEKMHQNKMMIDMAVSGKIKFESEEEEKDFMKKFAVKNSDFR